MIQIKTFNFTAKDNDDGSKTLAGSPKNSSYEGYYDDTSKFFVDKTGGGLQYINSLDNTKRGINNNDDFFKIEGSISNNEVNTKLGKEKVRFYPRISGGGGGDDNVGKDNYGRTGKTCNNLALFNGSAILKSVKLKFADIHLTQTLFQTIDNNNNSNTVKDDEDNSITNTNDSRKKLKIIPENNVFTFIDEGVKINGENGLRTVIGPNIYLGKGVEVGKKSKLKHIFVADGSVIYDNIQYEPSDDNFKGTKCNDTKFTNLTSQQTEDTDYYQISINTNKKIEKKLITKESILGLKNKILPYLGVEQNNNYLNRNLENKGLWIGKNIKVQSLVNLKKQENIILFNSGDSNPYTLNNRNNKYFKNCIIDLGYYDQFVGHIGSIKSVMNNDNEIYIFADPDTLSFAVSISKQSDSQSSSRRSSSGTGVSGTRLVSKRTSRTSTIKKPTTAANFTALPIEELYKNNLHINSTAPIRMSSNRNSSREKSSNNENVGFDSGEIIEEINNMSKDIKDLLQDFRGSEGTLKSGGGSNYLRSMQKVDDSLNNLKFLEKKIQEHKVGKDKDSVNIGLFNFITSDSKKELKNKQLLKSTKKLYDDLEDDKKHLEPYYSSKFILKSADIDKLFSIINKTSSDKLSSDSQYLSLVQKVVHSDKEDYIKKIINKIKDEFNLIKQQQGHDKGSKKKICQLAIDLMNQSKNSNTKLFSMVSNLFKDGEILEKTTCHGNQQASGNKKQKGQQQGQQQGQQPNKKKKQKKNQKKKKKRTGRTSS